jgi:hypothetical protein
MRLAFALIPCLLLGGLLHAQNTPCSACAKSETGPLPQGLGGCLSVHETASRIASSKPVAAPGQNEPHMNANGTVRACLCFSRTGKVTQASILSGPAMMQQPVLDSLKGWTFRPVEQGGQLYGGCGTLRIHVAMKDSQVRTTIEK